MITPDLLTGGGWLGALGLGVLTSLHPCPLTTNVAAIALVCARGGEARVVWIRSVSLVAGLCAGYAGVAAAIAGAFLATPVLASHLPLLVGSLLGPLLILAGGLMTGVFERKGAVLPVIRWVGRLRPDRWGWAGCFGAGLVLALGFCPATAGLFFAVLIPMAVADGRPALEAAAYGLGFGLPLTAVAMLIGGGATLGERSRSWASRLASMAGWVLIAVGAVLTLRLI